MAKFQYGAAVKDSFALVLNNLYIFLPTLALGMLVVLLMPFEVKLFDTTGMLKLDYMLLKPFFLFLAISSFIAFILISLFVRGWELAMVGKIVKKGKADLLRSAKDAPRTGLNFFLMMILILLVILAFFLLLAVLVVIGTFLAVLLKIIGAILIILFVLALIAIFLFTILSFIYSSSLIALGEGPVNAIKSSYAHFKGNKAHTLALFLIVLVFFVGALILMMVMLYFLIGAAYGPRMMEYMVAKPISYGIASFFAGLPSMFIMIWSFVFLTLSYSRKKKISAK